MSAERSLHRLHLGGVDLRRVLVPSVRLIATTYLYLVGILLLWVTLTMVGTGWKPAVITSGSMRPAIHTGDVILLADPPGDSLLGQNTIITFTTEDGTRITHRIDSVADGRYVTQGDANPAPDTEPVDPRQVEGVGRIVVPYIGLPVVWLERGDYPTLAATVVVTVAAAVATRRRRSDRAAMRQAAGSSGRLAQPIAQRGVRKVRILVGLIIVTQYLLDPDRFSTVVWGLNRHSLLFVSLAGLGGANLLSMWIGNLRHSHLMHRFAHAELLMDSAMVVLLTSATGSGGIGWVLYALPIVEASVRFGLAGALVHWMVLTIITLVTSVSMVEAANPGTTNVLNELERVLDNFSVLLLVVIPGAHLAEQLISELLVQRRATDEARDRGQLLHQVVELGQEVNRLGTELFSRVNRAALELGFDVADVCAQTDAGTWRVLAEASADGLHLPVPGAPGSCLRLIDHGHPAMIVDRGDKDPAELAAIAAVGLDSVVRFELGRTSGGVVCIRAGWRAGRPPNSAALDALRLLASQATVAMQNDKLVGELHQMHDEMEHQATHDALTGLANRIQLMSRLEEVYRPRDVAEPRAALLFLDLNGFKAVNDRLGHEAGDVLLKLVAQRLAGVLGDQVLLCRLGGDEFTVLITRDVSVAATETVSNLIVDSIVQPFKIGNETVKVGTSIGIGISAQGMTGSELLRRADTAMYHAKANKATMRFAHYDDEMDAEDRRREKMAAEITRAIANGYLHLVYQPIISVATGEIVGCEALVRWTHPELGAIGPMDIVALAEQTNQIRELNRWIAVQAATDCARWQRRPDGRPPFYVTINASPRELEHPALVDNVHEALVLAGLPPDALLVELSERIVSPDNEAYVRNMNGLAAIGVRLLMDDFGEGRTSLTFLRSLPISGIKLDRSLVVQSIRSEPDRIIVASVVNLGHQLDLTVVAEGVETAEHAQVVAELGVDFVQGYFKYRPMPAADLTEVLRQQEHQRALPGGGR